MGGDNRDSPSQHAIYSRPVVHRICLLLPSRGIREVGELVVAEETVVLRRTRTEQ